MIKSVRVVNFKSLAAVTIPMGRFNCLVGMNGAGKSTVLQALDFLAQLMRGDVQGWLDGRIWTVADLKCKLRTELHITFNVSFSNAAGGTLTWIGVFNRTDLRCTQESAFLQDEKNGVSTSLRLNAQAYSLDGREGQTIAFEYQGSILSALKDSEVPAALLEFRDALRSVRLLEVLSPDKLRKSARVSEHDIDQGGERLPAYRAIAAETATTNAAGTRLGCLEASGLRPAASLRGRKGIEHPRMLAPRPAAEAPMSGRTGNTWILGSVRDRSSVNIQVRPWLDGGGARSWCLVNVVFHHVEEIIDLVRRVLGWLNVRVRLGGHAVSLE